MPHRQTRQRQCGPFQLAEPTSAANPLRRSLVGKPLGRQPLQQNRRRGAEAAEAREEIPHVSKRTTNWIDSNVEILALLIEVIGDIVEDERPRQIGTLDCRARVFPSGGPLTCQRNRERARIDDHGALALPAVISKKIRRRHQTRAKPQTENL